MNISLTPELESAVKAKVASGLYNNSSEVIREALRESLRRESENQWIQREAAIGFAQLEAGQVVEVNSKKEFLAGRLAGCGAASAVPLSGIKNPPTARHRLCEEKTHRHYTVAAAFPRHSIASAHQCSAPVKFPDQQPRWRLGSTAIWPPDGS